MWVMRGAWWGLASPPVCGGTDIFGTWDSSTSPPTQFGTQLNHPLSRVRSRCFQPLIET